jgi:hypothetical protein
MGEVIDLDEFRALKEAQAKAEEEKKLAEVKQQELSELDYLKSVLENMVASLPAVSGAFYVPIDSNYIYEASNTHYYPEEIDIAPSDQVFFDYDWGWASEDDDENI